GFGGDAQGPREVEMVVARGSRMIARSISLQGTCEERAAVAAAIIERAIQPLLMPQPAAPKPSPPPPALDQAERSPELRPAARPQVKVGPDSHDNGTAEPEPSDALE